MNVRWLMLWVAGLGIAGLALVAADPALARSRHKAKPACAAQPAPFSWDGLLFYNGPPKPNGCAPAVFEHGKYVGQDPDLNIRAQLRRDPDTGYTPNHP